MATPPVVTRFVTSPTGHLHIGGARTALFCWAYAKGHHGRFMIRIEDTDQARSSEASARGILEDLAWLGIYWQDGPRFSCLGEAIGGDDRKVGPYFQAQRLHLYNAAVEKLVAEGKAYPAFESAEELEAKRKAAVAAKQTYRYDRAALSIPLPERLPRMKRAEKEGTAHVVRFLMPDTPVVVNDEVLGEVSYAAGEVDDFVIRKADGFPTYHFAVVVDDETMGVTHVLRGQEHLNNTPKHVALQRALGYRTPVYAHMPLIFNMDSTKMGKRDKDKAAREACRKQGIAAVPAPLAGVLDGTKFGEWLADSKSQLPSDRLERLAQYLKMSLPEVEVNDFRKAGYLPEVICNFIALLGWSPGHDIEKFDMHFLAERFDLPRIGKTNARFDRAKLLSFNTDAITALPPAEFVVRFQGWCKDWAPELLAAVPDSRFGLLCSAVQPRCKTFRDAADQARFLLTGDSEVEFDAKAVEKVLKKASQPGEAPGAAVLREFAAALELLPVFEPAPVHAAVESFAASRGLNMGKVAQPLRVALTGGTVSPPIEATLALLGKARAMARIERCLSLHGS